MKSIFKDHFVNYCTVQRRIASIHMVNDVVGDGKFIPLIAEDLRELADMIDRREAGCAGAQVFISRHGTEITFTGHSMTNEVRREDHPRSNPDPDWRTHV